MWEMNPPEPDDPFNPDKWEVGCETGHPKSVQQGRSTAIDVSDLRSKQGELQCKTMRSLRRSTACSASDHHTGRVSKPDIWWGTRSPTHCPFPPAGSPCLATDDVARSPSPSSQCAGPAGPNPEAVRREPSS